MVHRSLSLTLACCAGAVAGFSRGDDAPEAKTFMAQRGAIVFSDAMDQPLAAPWKTIKGTWKAEGGAMHVSEIASEMHGAVARRPLAKQDFIVQYAIRFDGGKQSSLSINDPKGHCCRVAMNPMSLTVMKDSHDHNMEDKSQKLDMQKFSMAPDEWHTVVVEIVGPEIVASVDGEHVAYGSHASIDVAKKDMGLTVAGDSVTFKDLRVWEATPKADWQSTKTQLPPRATQPATTKPATQ